MLAAYWLLALSAISARAASLVSVGGIVPNPNGVLVNFYVPDVVAASPPLLVALHNCKGSASQYYTDTHYASLADQHGYIALYPEAPRSGTCWDIGSAETLTHNARGDSQGIASAVRYAISTYGVDPSRVFVTGSGSGAELTNVLLGAYPDLFQGGSAFEGAPFGCYAGGSSIAYNQLCATGMVRKTAEDWGDLVRNAYPGYDGPRPKVQVWHGDADTVIYSQNFYEEIKQWTNVLGYTQSAFSNATNYPVCNYTTSTYGPSFQAIWAQGVGRVPVHEAAVLEFFGLQDLQPGPTPTTTVSSTATATATLTCRAPVATQTLWGQWSVGSPLDFVHCKLTLRVPNSGGFGCTGPIVCATGTTCTFSNSYFSQCLPSGNPVFK